MPQFALKTLNPTHIIKNWIFFSTQYQNVFWESQTEHKTTNLQTDDLVTILTFPQVQHEILTRRDEPEIAQESLTYRGLEVCKDALLPPVTHSLSLMDSRDFWEPPLPSYQILEKWRDPGWQILPFPGPQGLPNHMMMRKPHHSLLIDRSGGH